MCSTNCNWDTEEWFVFERKVIFVFTSCSLYRCDMGVDSNGCWLGNYCQDINAGDVTFV